MGKNMLIAWTLGVALAAYTAHYTDSPYIIGGITFTAGFLSMLYLGNR